MSDSPAPAQGTGRRDRTALVLAGALLFVVFWALYSQIGREMASHNALRNNVFFHSDIHRVIIDMAVRNAEHLRTNVHPLFVLFTHPLGVGLSNLLGSPYRAALLFNSLVGGLTVSVAFFFFWQAGVSLRRSFLGALLLGLSASHLYFGSAPETFIFSCLSIQLLLLCLVRRPGDPRWFLPAGIFSFGVLITNLAFVLATYASSMLGVWSFGHILRRTLVLAAGVVLIAASLTFVQRAMCPASPFFFVPANLAGESRFTPKDRTLTGTVVREQKLLRHVFVFDLFAPKVFIHKYGTARQALQMPGKSLALLSKTGKGAAMLWVSLLLAALWIATWRGLVKRPLFIGLIVCLVYNFVLHSAYGDDLFLYSCNSTFALLALVLCALSEIRNPRWVMALDLLLALLVIAEGANNFRFFKALTSMHTIS